MADKNDGAPPQSDERYECPVTGAHFGFRDMCRRLKKKLGSRIVTEENKISPIKQ